VEWLMEVLAVMNEPSIGSVIHNVYSLNF